MTTVCAYLITLQDMAHQTYFPDPKEAGATTLNVDTLVYMACCDFQGDSLNFTTPEGGQSYGLD